MSRPTLVVLAAGRARRYGGLKPLAPVGPGGAAVLDVVAGDALASGFARVVIVVNPETGPLLEDHVARRWPRAVPVSFAVQEQARGTVEAVLSARGSVGEGEPFAVANADDLYGRAALALLADHLVAAGENCLVAYRLDRVVHSADPVTRGVCAVRDGRLCGLTERREVRRGADGFSVSDGGSPATLDAGTRVSMNLWGFAPTMWSAMAAAMDAAVDASEQAEVLLPTLVGALVAAGSHAFAVLATDAVCLGVTHADDVGTVAAAVAAEVARGERPADPFSA